MPQLTVAHTTGQRPAGRGDRRWMEEEKKDEAEEAAAGRSGNSHRPNQLPPAAHPTSWSHLLQTLPPWKSFCYFVPVAAVWLVCQLEALPPSPLPLTDAWWRLMLMCLLWLLVGVCVHALRCSLRPVHTQVEPRIHHSKIQGSWAPQPRNPDRYVPLAFALTNSLMLCILQEPLPDPSVPYIQALLSRLEAVSLTLQEASLVPEVAVDRVDAGSSLRDRLKLMSGYLQQRMALLRALVQVQADLEVSVKDMLEGLAGLWAQLEELHTGVTLTKEGGREHGDVALACTDAQNLFSVLSRYKNKLQCCQTHLKDVTQLLQELTWSHTHIHHRVCSSSSGSSSSESVWPELLLQSNIEQFDKVQESFFSLEQQTSTFQAHLEGLRRENQEGHARPPSGASDGATSGSASPQSRTRVQNGSDGDSRSTSPSVSSMEMDTEAGARLSLCERSALHFSSTIGRLRKSGRKKK